MNNKNKETLALLGSLSSKICHDIVAPVSAIDMGLSLLNENLPLAIKEDPSYLLLKDSVTKTLNRINFFRYAFAFGKSDPPPTEAEFSTYCKNVCAHNNLQFFITTFDPNTHEQSLHLRLIACILYLTLDCLPKGGKIELAVSKTVTQFEVSGPMLIINSALEKIMSKQQEPFRAQVVIPELVISGFNYLKLHLNITRPSDNKLILSIQQTSNHT